MQSDPTVDIKLFLLIMHFRFSQDTTWPCLEHTTLVSDGVQTWLFISGRHSVVPQNVG